ncbi:MAG: hypothetical protein AAF441_22680, partial [Pseudomonadota bacterium]
MGLRFHWMLPKSGEWVAKTPEAAARYRVEATTPVSDASNPDIPGWQDFAKSAEEAGIDSLLISFSRAEPDPML